MLTSNRVRAFNAAIHALLRPLLQNALSALQVVQRFCILKADVRAVLKPSQTVDENGQQRLVRDAIHASLGNGAVLEKQDRSRKRAFSE